MENKKINKLIQSCNIKYRRRTNSNKFILTWETSREDLEEFLGTQIQIKDVNVIKKPTTREILLNVQSKVLGMQTQMNGMQTQMNGMQTQIDDIQLQVNKNGKRLDKIEKDVSMIKSLPTIRKELMKKSTIKK